MFSSTLMSSERHVINDHQALSQWSESRPKRLAIQQFAMLAAALEAVRIEGRSCPHLLYQSGRKRAGDRKTL
jgi:16S rRNA C967 or C1407 C5-methylase (RsmB/RsmF family)